MLFIIKYNFFFGSLVLNLNKSSSYKRTIINYFVSYLSIDHPPPLILCLFLRVLLLRLFLLLVFLLRVFLLRVLRPPRALEMDIGGHRFPELGNISHSILGTVGAAVVTAVVTAFIHRPYISLLPAQLSFFSGLLSLP